MDEAALRQNEMSQQKEVGMKKYVLFLFMVLLAFSASAQAFYPAMGLVGTPANMLLMSGCNSALLMTANPSLLPVMMGCSSPLVMVHTTPILPMMPACVAPILMPCGQSGSSVQVIGVQMSSAPSTQDTIFSIITHNTN
jgi:hypothetical protein